MNGGHPGLNSEISHPVVDLLLLAARARSRTKNPQPPSARIMFCRLAGCIRNWSAGRAGETMYCSNCGKDIGERPVFCQFCGTRVAALTHFGIAEARPSPALAQKRKSPASAAASRAISIWTLRSSVPLAVCVFFWRALVSSPIIVLWIAMPLGPRVSDAARISCRGSALSELNSSSYRCALTKVFHLVDQPSPRAQNRTALESLRATHEPTLEIRRLMRPRRTLTFVVPLLFAALLPLALPRRGCGGKKQTARNVPPPPSLPRPSFTARSSRQTDCSARLCSRNPCRPQCPCPLE